MKDDIRRILNRAERALGDEVAERELLAEGVLLGETVEMSGPEFLATLGDEAVPPRVLVTIYEEPARYRARFEDALCEFVEREGIGAWIGGGQGSIGATKFFDVMLEVQDHETAAGQVRAFVSATFPDLTIEVSGLPRE